MHKNFARGQQHLVAELVKAEDNGLGIQISDLKKSQQRSQSRHSKCLIKTSHRSGKRSLPKSIKNFTAKIVKGIATGNDFHLLEESFAVYISGENNEGDGASSESVEIICYII